MPKDSALQKILLWSNNRHLSQRDLPIASDGLYDWQAENVDDNPETISYVSKVFKEMGAVGKKNRTAPHLGHVVGNVPRMKSTLQLTNV